jgi:hypothetical protein
MGLLSARRKRAYSGQIRLAIDLSPDPAIGSRLINPAGFDKEMPPVV